MKKILMIGTGGTIASTKTTNGGLHPQLTSEEMLMYIPYLGLACSNHTK
ncbi:MAG: Asparaginase, N-terminal [Firmicutes bacterium]|nr:Asparaginase, N-terminal [Bacillota bacterium]